MSFRRVTSNTPGPDPDADVVTDFENLCVCLFLIQETLQICYGPTLYGSGLWQHCHGSNLLWAEMSTFPEA